MDFEAKATHDNRFILGECLRGEEAAKGAYEKAIGESLDMPDSVRGLLLRQQQEVAKVYDVIKRRRDGTYSPTQEKMEKAKHQFDEKFAATKEKFQAEGEEFADIASEKWEDVKVEAVSTRERISGFIRENPIPILLGALGTGLAIGLLFYARELRNERARLALLRNPLNRLGLGAKAAMQEFRLRAKDNLAAVQDRMEDLQAKGKKGAFMKKLRKAMAQFTD